MNNNLKVKYRRSLSILLVLTSIVLCFMVPVTTSAAQPTDLSNGKLFDFSSETVLVGSNQLIDGTTTTSSTTLEEENEKRVAGWSWSLKKDGSNTYLRTSKGDSTTWGTGGALRLNASNEFCILKPSQSYFLKIRYKVVSAHKTFVSGGVTYPLETSYSTLKVGYGAAVSSYRDNGNGMGSLITEVATLAKISNNKTTYLSYDYNGNETEKKVGTWYTEEIYFTTPEDFGGKSQHLALLASNFTGADIYIDTVFIEETTTVNLELNGGSGIDVNLPSVVGEQIDIPSPEREGYVFGGWYKDRYCTQKFTDTVFTSENCNITLYAKWENKLNTQTVDFFDYETGSTDAGDYRSNVKLDSNTFTSKNLSFVSTGTDEGTKELYLNGFESISKLNPAYFPLGNLNGNIRLKSNTTYTVLVDYDMNSETSSQQYKIRIFTASPDNASDGAVDVTEELMPNGENRHYITFTTGNIQSGKDAVYFEISYKSEGIRNITFRKVKFMQIDDGMSFVRAYDSLNGTVYELFGYTGDSFELPQITDDTNFKFDGWYTDETFTNKSNAVFGSEKNAFLYSYWENKPVDFENFVPIIDNSYYVVGKDINITKSSQSYSGEKMLKYVYTATPNYFESYNNAVALAVLYDNTTYKVTFKYRLNSALDDVELKFFSAHRGNRFRYVRNYDDATYTVYSKEAGEGWKEATVYFTADLVNGDNSNGLFLSFNPLTEGKTELCIDDFTVETVKADNGVVAFLGKDGKSSGIYTMTAVGRKVYAPDEQPCGYFSSFEGWYSDAECTSPFEALNVTSGITYVYSKWQENSENFEGYIYENNKVVKDGANTVLKNGTAKLGTVEDGTVYKVTYRFKTAKSGTSVSLKTADKKNNSKNVTQYDDEGSTYTVDETYADGKWHTVTRYISTSFAGTDTDFGDTLYITASGNISVDDISIKEVSALSQKGSSVLKTETSDGRQAMRFYFGYTAQNSAVINLDGEEFTLAERGIIIKDSSKNSSLQALTLSCVENGEEGYVKKSINYGFGSYWSYDSDSDETVYSYYITGLYKNDVRNITARGYIKVKDAGGNIYTLYSPDVETCVKSVKAVAAEITDVDVHTFAGKNWNRFTIVNPKVMPYIYGLEIENLIEYADSCGVKLNRVTEKSNETPYEIVIGDTTRDASDLVEVKESNDYIIAVKGTKLIIKGGSDIATKQAVSDFIEYLKLKDSLGCGADLKDGFVMTGSYEASSDKYKLTLNDDFDTLDTSLWSSYAGQNYGYFYSTSVLGGSIGHRSVSGNAVVTKSGETKKLVDIRDGNLVLGTAYVTPTEEKDIANNVDIINANVSTFFTMLYKYGILEIRSKVAEAPACVSFWINGDGGDKGVKNGCMTEYDLIETFGYSNYFASCIHQWSNNYLSGALDHFNPDSSCYTGNLEQRYTPDIDEESLYDGYHIYTFLWENEKIVFAFDGVKYCEYDIPDSYKENSENNIILSTGMGSPTYGTRYNPSIHKEYYETLIDYVRIYQVEDMGSTMVWKK